MSKARRFISVRRYGGFGLAVSFRESPRSVSCCVTRVGISPILRCRFRSWGRSNLSPTLSACVSPVPLFHPRRSALPFLGGRAGAKRPKAPFSSRAFYPLTILLSSVYYSYYILMVFARRGFPLPPALPGALFSEALWNWWIWKGRSATCASSS